MQETKSARYFSAQNKDKNNRENKIFGKIFVKKTTNTQKFSRSNAINIDIS